MDPKPWRDCPALTTTDPNRFTARAKYLAGVGRMPWLTWRSRAIAALYVELADAARAASPGAVLALATPGLHGGAAGAEARRVDLAGLAPSQAWRSVGLDLEAWPSGPGAPIILRGVELSTDPLARDLATSPDLDAKVATRRDRGVLLTMGVEPANPTARGLAESAGSTTPGAGALAPGSIEGPRPGSGGSADETSHVPLMLATLPLGDGAAADEPLEHALAAFDAQWVILAAPAVAGHEDRLRRFATVLRCLPAWQALPGASPADHQDHGVCRAQPERPVTDLSGDRQRHALSHPPGGSDRRARRAGRRRPGTKSTPGAPARRREAGSL